MFIPTKHKIDEEDSLEERPAVEVSPEQERPTWLKILFYRLRGLFKRSASSLKESVEEVLEEHDAAGLYVDPKEKEILQNVLTFSELDVEDVMVPRSDIIAIPHDISFENLKALLIQEEHAHTRMPVYRETLDDILGFVHVKDFVRALSNMEAFDLQKLIREVLFVPPSMKVKDLLVNMRLSRVHMVIVVDEFGGTAGLATMEDLVEEIVGEIHDEHDTAEGIIIAELGKDILKTSARIGIAELENRLGASLRVGNEEEYDTLGGLIYSLTGRIPITGELIAHPAGFEFEIAEADPRAVRTVIIRKISHVKPDRTSDVIKKTV